MWITVLDLIFCDLQVSLLFLRALGDMRVLLFSSLSKSVHSSLLVYDCLQILKHVAAIFMVCNFHFTFVSIFECSTSFVPIYLILTLCFYQHEDVSMNLDLLKKCTSWITLCSSGFLRLSCIGKLSPAYGDVVHALLFLKLRGKEVVSGNCVIGCFSNKADH